MWKFRGHITVKTPSIKLGNEKENWTLSLDYTHAEQIHYLIDLSRLLIIAFAYLNKSSCDP